MFLRPRCTANRDGARLKSRLRMFWSVAADRSLLPRRDDRLGIVPRKFLPPAPIVVG